MNATRFLRGFARLAALLWACSATAAPLGTAFTYQGQLADGGAAANGNYDLTFTLYDDASGGTTVAGPITNSAAGVSNGLFTALLDFGPGVFDGSTRWIEIAVRTNAVGDFVVLTPRHSITPAPYALHARSVTVPLLLTGAAAPGTAVLSVGSTGDGVAIGASSTNGDIAVLGKVNTAVWGISPSGFAGYFDGKGFFSGNVGIGTNNPQSALHVIGTVAATAFSGDGASLSNLNAGQLTGTLSSNQFAPASITATMLAAGAVTSGKILDGTIAGADLANNTVTSAQLADSIDLGTTAVSGQLNVYRTGAGTPGVTLFGGASQISTYGSDGLEQIRLSGIGWGQMLLHDDVGNDTTVAVNANTDGGGSLYLYHSNNSARASIVASSLSGDLQLYGTNGAARSQLHGGSDGSYLSLYAAAGTSGLYLDGEDGGGGSIGVRNTNGNNRVFIDGQGNSGGGQINLHTGGGLYGAILYGDLSGAGAFYLYNTNSLYRLLLDGLGDAGGGQMLFRANDSATTLNLRGDNGSGAGQISVNNASSVEGVRLSADLYGGQFNLYDEAGASVVLVDNSSSGGGYAYFYQADGQAGLYLDGDNSGAGLIYVYNTNGVAGITLDGNSAGNCRVITEELQITGGADLSENFDIQALEAPQPGMVVCIDPARPGELAVSAKAYDRTVAGVISGAGGVKPGLLMGQAGTKADGKHPVALTGRVYCLADAAHGAIQPGDLLTTSATPGHAMKAADLAQAQGAVIGKAMTSLADGQGLVLVLVSLQ